MRNDIFVAMAITLAVILSGVPAPSGAGPAVPRTPDADNDFASATAMTPGTAYPGTVDSSDDPQDYYSAQSASPGQIFNVSVQVSAGAVRLVAYDFSMAMLEESNLGGPWESLSIDAVKWNAKYYFAVFITSGTVATYSIQVVLESAKLISWSGQDGGSLARASDNPADWYVFSLSGGNPNDVAQFTINHDPSLSIDVWTYDLWPGLTTSVCNISLNHVSGKTIAFAGTHTDPWYRLKVWARSGSGNYTINMWPQQTIPGDNDYSAGNAHRLGNTPQAGSLDSAWDHFEYFKCFLAQGETLKVRMNLTQNVTGKFNLYVYHVDGQTYYQDANTSNFIQGVGWTNYVTITWTAASQGDYFIIPMADEAHDASGNPTSGASNAGFTIRVEQPDPLNHAPYVSNPQPNPYPISEDSVNFLLFYLGTIFTEPDGESMSYAVTGSGNISLRLGDDSSVYATTTPDWSGIEMVSFTATDTSGKTIVYKLNIEVRQVPDPPVLLKPIVDQTVVEDLELVMDLSQYFTDADLPYVYGEHLEYRVYSMNPVVPTIPWRTDNESQTLTFGPARNLNHQKEFYVTRLVTLRVTDRGAQEVHARQFTFNLTVTPINHAPNYTVPIIPIIINEDENDSSINVPKYFYDYDIPMGDVLQYKALRSEHINVTLKPGYFLEVRPEKDWNGIESVYVTATDLSNESATIEVNVTVNPIDDPPVIVPVTPVVQDVYVNETETLNFSVAIIDPDSNASAIAIIWLVNGQVQFGAKSPTFSFVTTYDSAGISYTVQVNASDGERTSTYTWNVQVNNTNRKPIVNITSPQEGGIYAEGQMIRLSAEASDPDFDPLTCLWKEGNATIGRQRSTTYKFAPGRHTITILVDDGKDTTAASVSFQSDSVPNITVLSPEDRTHFKTSALINFSAIAFDRDGDPVTVQWRERSKTGKDNVLASVANFTKKLGKGAHEIYVNVTDGRNSVESPLMLIFADEATPAKSPIPGLGATGVLAAVVAAAAAVAILGRKRGHGTA